MLLINVNDKINKNNSELFINLQLIKVLNKYREQ